MRRSAASTPTDQAQNSANTNPYELRQVRFALTQAQASRTQSRVEYYNALSNSITYNEAHESSSTQQSSSTTTGPIDIEGENPEFTQLQWIAESSSTHAKPYSTFPWCSYHKITWNLVTSDETGLIWTRTLLDGQQEWLTGSLLANGQWQFNQTREVCELYPS